MTARNWCRAIATVCVLVLGFTARPASAAEPKQPDPKARHASSAVKGTTETGPRAPDTTVPLRNANSNRCLGIANGNMTNGTKAIQWDCNGSNDQYWWINFDWINDGVHYALQNSVNRYKCLGVPDGSQVSGTQLVIWDCTFGARDQRWSFWRTTDGQLLMQNLNSGQVIGVSGGDQGNGARIVQWPNTGSWDQRWYTYTPRP